MFITTTIFFLNQTSLISLVLKSSDIFAYKSKSVAENGSTFLFQFFLAASILVPFMNNNDALDVNENDI